MQVSRTVSRGSGTTSGSAEAAQWGMPPALWMTQVSVSTHSTSRAVMSPGAVFAASGILLAVPIIGVVAFMALNERPSSAKEAPEEEEEFLTTRKAAPKPSASSAHVPTSIGSLPASNLSVDSVEGDPSVFCPMLVVPRNQPSGMTLMIDGDILPTPQEAVVYISKFDGGDLLFQALISETGRDRGILLEYTTGGAHLAFIDTSGAVSAAHQTLHPQPRTAIFRAVGRSKMRAKQPFSMFQAEPHSHSFVARRGTGTEPLLVVNTDAAGQNYNILDASGSLQAATQVQKASGQRKQMQVHLKCGADAGFILCVVLSALKLGPMKGT